MFSLCCPQLMKIMQNENEFCNVQLSSNAEAGSVSGLSTKVDISSARPYNLDVSMCGKSGKQNVLKRCT